MFNLKTGKGSFKGFIGECMFKLNNRKVIMTTFFNKLKYIDVFGNYFNKEQKTFLLRNWHSFDAIEIVSEKGITTFVLYEIKTRNHYHNPSWYKPKMTFRTHNLYNQSKLIGFTPKIVHVWLYDNWDYDIKITDFEGRYYCIDKEKKYDYRVG